MALWALAFFLFFVAVQKLVSDSGNGLGLGRRISQARREEEALRSVDWTLLEFSEILEAGLVPESSRWQRLRGLPTPWGELTSVSLNELRNQGAAVLPTLRRMRELAHHHLEALKKSRTRSAQALTQAGVCAFLVPLLGGLLWALLPAVQENALVWWSAVGVALVLSGAGAFWMFLIAERARWGGLGVPQRPWLLGALCAGERLLALIRCGVPADLAWVQSCEFLSQQVDGLAVRWGHSIWEAEVGSFDSFQTGQTGLERVLVDVGASLRRSIHLSLMEGKPCSERVETLLRALRQDIDGAIELQIEKVGARVLKPLFLCVAPALLGLLAFGLYLMGKAHGLG